MNIDQATELKVEVTSSDYSMIHPLEGRIGVAKDKLEFFIELQVLSSEAEIHYIQQINSYQKSLKKLEIDNAATIEELNRLNQTMLDTINHFYRQQQESERVINSQIEQLKAAAEENQELNNQIVVLEKTIQSTRAVSYTHLTLPTTPYV